MMEKITKIYLSRQLLMIAASVAIVGYIVSCVYLTVTGGYADSAWILFGLVSLLVVSYFSGNISVQKMLFGALLMFMVKEILELMWMEEILYGRFYVDIALLILSVGIFFAHMFMQMDHTGKTPALIVNQLLGIVAAVFIFYAVENCFAPECTVHDVSFPLAYAATCIMVICMETRIEKYKEIRKEAQADNSWTEEKREEAKKLFKLF